MDIIFDIDGTLMDIEHRRPFVTNKPKDWKSFNWNMRFDTANEQIVNLAWSLQSMGHTIIISTGRSEEFKQITQEMLAEFGVKYHAIYMRKHRDSRGDVIVKREMLEEMREDGYNPTLVFDDRDGVVAMWREEGLVCCQVAPGDF